MLQSQMAATHACRAEKCAIPFGIFCLTSAFGGQHHHHQANKTLPKKLQLEIAARFSYLLCYDYPIMRHSMRTMLHALHACLDGRRRLALTAAGGPSWLR